MKVYEKINLRHQHIVMIGVAVFLALSSGLNAPSLAAQSTIGAGSNDENKTMTMSPTTSVANTTASGPNATLVEFASNMEQIRGHLEQALANKKSGNNTLAQAHTLHPVEEVYSSIEGQLARQNSTLNQTLSTALQNLSASATNGTVQEFESQAENVNMLLNNSMQAVVPAPEFNNTAFDASVAARLLDTAGHEYEEGVTNGTVKAIVEYQDAQAFIHRSEIVFNASSDKINQSMTHEVQEVNKFFSTLNDAVTGKGDPKTVETTINAIIHELAEITSLSENQLIGETGTETDQDPTSVINNIKSLLNQLLSAYKSQNYTGAESLAIEAYLENYESIEEPIAQHDQQLMKQTEIMLREDLRHMVKDRVPVEQVQQQVDMINANLDKAANMLQ
jgi:hypothetical protein